MPISLMMNDEQMEVFERAIKGKNITFKNAGRTTVLLTAENWEAIRAALTELHAAKFAIRTKTIGHLETCYHSQEVIKKIDHMENDLRKLPPQNDNSIGIVTQETTSTDETPPAVEAETPPAVTTEATEEKKTNARSRK